MSSTRLKTWIEQAGDDWHVTIELDDYPIFEECYFGEFEARAAAAEFEAQLLRDLCGDAIERSAAICDRLAEMREAGAGDYPKGQRLRQAARLIRGGGK
jgi:hypothetical protein